MKSNMIKAGETYYFHKNNYLRVNKTCFVQLYIYGGCIITYDELVDKNLKQWATRLNKLCGIDSKILIKERDESINEFKNINMLPDLDEDVVSLYNLIYSKKEEIFMPDLNKLH